MCKEDILVFQNKNEEDNSICEDLEKEGFSVFSATDIDQGLKHAIEDQPEVVIVDTDNSMKACIDTCRIIADNDRTSSHIIVISSRNDLATKISCFLAGAKRYITKPFQNHELFGEIKNVIRQKKITHSQMHDGLQENESNYKRGESCL